MVSEYFCLMLQGRLPFIFNRRNNDDGVALGQEWPRARPHLRQLDGVRGVAACVVAFFHSRIIYGGAANPFSGFYLIDWFRIWGWSMVDLFFVLSGFVFSHCYLQRWRMRESATISDFVVARIARLWPLHVVLTAFAVVLMSHNPSTTWQNTALSFAMLQLFASEPSETLIGPAWSLSVEMICYCVFAAAAFTGPRTLKMVAFVAIGWSAWEIMSVGPWGALLSRGLLGFFTGVVLCNSLSLTDRIPSPVLALMLVFPILVPPEGAALVPIVLFSWSSVILLALRTDILKFRPFLWLGDRSYAIYLVHTLIYFIVYNMAIIFGFAGREYFVVITLVSWILVMVTSNFLYSALERPAQKAILAWAHGLPMSTRRNVRSEENHSAKT